MSAERWEHLKSVFYQALDQPPEQRRAWLAAACHGDRSMQQEVEALLVAHDTAGDFLEQPATVGADGTDTMTLVPGTRLGPYEVIREIGRGGMGIVYLAEDHRLGRRVALKALPAAVADDVDYRARLRREARAAATISHPSVATIYALEEIDGALFIASEYVPGRSLRAELEHGPFEASRARMIAIDVARALAAAHDAGVIHRDLKPDNVLLTDGGVVKVVDFGVAHVQGTELTRLTRAGAMLGTPAYMAPEQLVGGLVDPRTDLFAFGILLSEMLTGRHPLLPSAGAEPPRTVPFAAVIARCLQPDPAARFGSARDLLTALDAGTPAAVPTATPERWWWEVHQGIVSLVYALLLIAMWGARTVLGGALGRTLFIAAAIAVTIDVALRLHLWFTSRFYPVELSWVRGRARHWVLAADWMFVATLIAGGVMSRDTNAALAALLLGGGIGAAVGFLVIEPVTTRAAFRNSAD